MRTPALQQAAGAKGAHPLWSKSRGCGTQSRSLFYCVGHPLG